ncbi:MAG: BamA/TamA family outer membrane protein [Steroidobacteraceae bacterium]
MPTFRALIGIASCSALVWWGAPAARAADPQTYKVEFAPTGEGAMDGTLRATSDLQSLRSSAPVSPYGLIARARGDVDRLKTVLESYGYYQSKVTMKIDGLALNDPGLAEELAALPKKREARVQVSFALGPLYHLRKVAIDGELPPTAQGALGLKSGAPAVAADVLGAGAHLLSALQEQGYAFAKVDPPVAYEDQIDPVLDVSFHVEAGQRVNIGEIHIQGLKRVHEKVLRRRLLLHTGELFKLSAVEHARTDLLSLNVFAAINVQIGSAVDGTGGVPITFKIRERLRHTFGINAAYSSDLGGSGGVTWSDRNVFGNAEQLTISASLTGAGGSSTTGLGYNTSVKYTLPDFGHRDQSLQFAVSAIKQDLEAYDQTGVTVGVTLARKLDKRWTASVGVTATEERINQIVCVSEQPVNYVPNSTSVPCTPTPPCTDVVLGAITTECAPYADRDLFYYTLLALPLTLSYDSTELASPLDDPTHGIRGSVTLAPTRSVGHSDADFLIATVKVSGYFDLDHLFPTDPGRSVLAARALAGTAQGADVLSLPPDQRFYGGGSSSIRGYPYQAVGPYFPGTTYPIGATAISAGSLEYRQRFGQSFGAAFFVDGGQVGNKFSLNPTNLFVGVGAGVRYYTPIGPIRLDLAVPLKRYDTDPSPFQIYIGLGQAY